MPNYFVLLRQLLYNAYFLYFLAFFAILVGVVRIFTDIPVWKETLGNYPESEITSYETLPFAQGVLQYAPKFSAKRLPYSYPEDHRAAIKVKAIYKKADDGYVLLEIGRKSLLLRQNHRFNGYRLVQIEKEAILLKKRGKIYRYVLKGFQKKGRSER